MRQSIIAICAWLCSVAIINVFGQEVSEFILVDQFGYLPESEKVAVIKDPVTGFDASASFSPGENYALVDARSNEHVFLATPVAWSSGDVNGSSGDKAWWFDFSLHTTQGEYYVLDIDNNVRSHNFWISEGVYNEILRQAVRTFFFQRAGHAKEEQFTGAGWSDEASHLGSLQDKNCRIFDDPNNASTERDVSGGWYDAGDYNKYTNWTANYVVDLMKAYLERPEAWTDDYNIPESGNGIPDLLDETRWGIEHLLRLQENDGRVLCIVDMSHASPPSSASERSLYGPATTSASLNTAAAFAISAKVFKLIGDLDFAMLLEEKAEDAWNWAVANPAVLFRNNDPAYNSQGIGAGQQEENEYQRSMSKLEAACFLFDLTKGKAYHEYFDAHYSNAHMFAWNFAYPFEADVQETLLYYTTIEGHTESVANHIINTYRGAMQNGSENFPAYEMDKDAYRAHLKDYTWGSNGVKCSKANMFTSMVSYEVDTSRNEDATAAAQEYLHYLHGVNPLGIVYLSNMYGYGGDKGVNEFYHTWFTNGSEKWDRYGESIYGPAPGFLTGGPNPSYNWDGCCPGNCGSANNNAVCNSESISPPRGQPNQKSYKDFNTSWPLNSWSVTENSCGYQVRYIRLLSKYVSPGVDCSGEEEGTADYDACGNCSGGNTGIIPITDPENCGITSANSSLTQNEEFTVRPNPANDYVEIVTEQSAQYELKLIDMLGVVHYAQKTSGNQSLNISDLQPGPYVVIIVFDGHSIAEKLIID